MPRKDPGAPPKKGGPARLIDAAKRRELINAVKVTGSLKQAAAFCEVSYDTLARERDRDPVFADSLTQAVEICKYECVKFLRDSNNVAAVTFFLERRFPEEFGRRSADAFTPAQFNSEMNRCLAIALEGLPKKYAQSVLRNIARYQEQLGHGATGKGTR